MICLLKKSCKHILDTNPDAVVLADYPGFHLQLAKRIKKANPGQRILYYICPKFWAWNYRRVKKRCDPFSKCRKKLFGLLNGDFQQIVIMKNKRKQS